MDLTYFVPSHQAREPASLVVTGKMSYHANVTAVLHLVHDIMPHVWRERPDVELWIVGKDPPREITHLQPPEPARGKGARIVVTGTVPNLSIYLQQATLAVVPMPYGAGIQNKALEAMACGTPVVASPQACTALRVQDGEHLLVADGPQAFARAVLDLLADPVRQKEVGQAGRRYVEAHHNWAVIAERLERIYRDAIGVYRG